MKKIISLILIILICGRISESSNEETDLYSPDSFCSKVKNPVTYALKKEK